MLIQLDSSSQVPLYAQLIAALRKSIINGEIEDGHRLPSAADLADSLDLNRNTVLRAYRELRDDGLVELRRGRGATVTRPETGSHGGVEKLLDELADAAIKTHIPLADLVAGLSIRGVL